MSAISNKKIQQKKGPETIFIYMGITFIIADFIGMIIFFIAGGDLNSTFMVPILYFLMLSGLCMGRGSYLKENNQNLQNFSNWFWSFIFIGIFVAAIMGTYMW